MVSDGGLTLVVTFYSVSSALLLEQLLRGGAAGCRVVPVPRSLSSSCGYAALVNAMQADALRTLMDGQGVEWEGLYQAETDGGRERYRPLAHT